MKNINPFSLERKTFNNKEREIVYMFWDNCINSKFYKDICLPENFMYLNGKNVLYPWVAEIVWKHTENGENNIYLIRKNLIENKNIFQSVYSKTYFEILSFVESEVLISGMNFLWNSRNGKTKKLTKAWRATAANTTWCF